MLSHIEPVRLDSSRIFFIDASFSLSLYVQKASVQCTSVQGRKGGKTLVKVYSLDQLNQVRGV